MLNRIQVSTQKSLNSINKRNSADVISPAKIEEEDSKDNFDNKCCGKMGDTQKILNKYSPKKSKNKDTITENITQYSIFDKYVIPSPPKIKEISVTIPQNI